MNMHGYSLTSVYGHVLEREKELGLMEYQNGFWYLTRYGMDIQNTVLIDFLP